MRHSGTYSGLGSTKTMAKQHSSPYMALLKAYDGTRESWYSIVDATCTMLAMTTDSPAIGRMQHGSLLLDYRWFTAAFKGLGMTIDDVCEWVSKAYFATDNPVFAVFDAMCCDIKRPSTSTADIFGAVGHIAKTIGWQRRGMSVPKNGYWIYDLMVVDVHGELKKYDGEAS